MSRNASVAVDERSVPDPSGTPSGSGVMPFLAAGAVLFASLVVGSSASLFLAGSNQLIAAILHGFLSLGLWALGGCLAAVMIILIVAAGRRCSRATGNVSLWRSERR